MGLDLGTSTIKAVRCNPVYGLVGKSSREVEILSPEPGRKEIDAEKYFSTVLELIQELAALSAEPVAAIAWDAASGNTLLCDRNAKPLTPALSWLDTRLDWLPPETWQVREVTGWPRISSFPLMHLEYFRRNMPMTLRSAHVTMLNEWLSWRLTGERGIDFSSATPFYLVNQTARRYQQDYLDYFRITTAQLPDLVATGTTIGMLKKEYASGALSAQTRVVAGSFDHPSGARAAGISKPGELLLSFGTSWVGFYPVLTREEIPPHELVDPFQSASGGCWGGMFSLAGAGLEIAEFVHTRYGNTPEAFDEFNREALDDSTPAAKLMMHVTGRFCRLLGTRKFGRMVMIGGPSEGPAWKKYLTQKLDCTIEVSPYGSCTCAMGAAGIAAGKEK